LMRLMRDAIGMEFTVVDLSLTASRG
jgi:hypothetical protein